MLTLIKNANHSVIAKKVHVAQTFFERFIGLMGKQSLDPFDALWIRPCHGGIHTFFMKFSIDVLFVNTKLQICHIRKNIKPWRIVHPPLFSGTYSVFEFPAPALHDFNLKNGDYLSVEKQ